MSISTDKPHKEENCGNSKERYQSRHSSKVWFHLNHLQAVLLLHKVIIVFAWNFHNQIKIEMKFLLTQYIILET